MRILKLIIIKNLQTEYDKTKFMYLLILFSQIFRELFCVMGTWYVDGSSYISLAGELKSPFKILDELKASLLYSHELEKEAYCLEAYMKYSNKTEMKARVNLRPPNVTLNLETSMEGLR